MAGAAAVRVSIGGVALVATAAVVATYAAAGVGGVSRASTCCVQWQANWASLASVAVRASSEGPLAWTNTRTCDIVTVASYGSKLIVMFLTSPSCMSANCTSPALAKATHGVVGVGPKVLAGVGKRASVHVNANTHATAKANMGTDRATDRASGAAALMIGFALAHLLFFAEYPTPFTVLSAHNFTNTKKASQ